MTTTDKLKNTLQTTKGKVEKEVGKATNDRSLEAEGKRDEVSGHSRQAVEHLKDAAKQ